MIIARMDMRNLTLHRLRQVCGRQMIRQEKSIHMSLQIRLLKFDKVIIAISERGKGRAEFLILD
jgi:hypothetical protein